MEKKHQQRCGKASLAGQSRKRGLRADCVRRALARLTALSLLSTTMLSAAGTTAIAATNSTAARAGGAPVGQGAAVIAAGADAAGTRTASLARAFFDAEEPVAPAELDTMRGGLNIGGGLLQVSFGIERTVSLNGEVMSRNTMLLNSARGSGDAADAAARTGLSDIKLIQNGSGNVMQATPGAYTAGGLVIQNSLNNQHIQSQTVITASVNSMEMLKALNFQGSLSDALAHAVPAR